MGQRHPKERLLKLEEARIAKFEYGICPSDCIQHYVPPNFPLEPDLNKTYVMDCVRTWKLIVMAATGRMAEYKRPGIVLFYDEFFYRLFQRDFTMEYVFPDVSKRSSVLIKAMTFMLKNSAEDNDQVISRCNFLGHRHKSFHRVRPHHFAQYTSTAVEVIMYWLGEYATREVGEAWSNVVGFYVYHILEAYLAQKVDPFESYQNTVISAVQEIADSRGAMTATGSEIGEFNSTDIEARHNVYHQHERMHGSMGRRMGKLEPHNDE